MNAVARSAEQERSLVFMPALRDGKSCLVLAVIGRAYLVIDEVGGVVQASPVRMRWVRRVTRYASDELADMTAQCVIAKTGAYF